jgi:chorismate mutase
MQILALPMNQEALIESGALPYCAELLCRKIADFSEISHCASWIDGIEFDIWLQLQEDPVENPNRFQLSAKARQDFKEIEKLIGGWVIRDKNNDFLYLPDLVFIKHFRNTQPPEKVERFQRVASNRLIATLDEIGRSQKERGIETPSAEKIERIVDQVCEELYQEKIAGTYIEPISSKRMREAFSAYHAWYKNES